MKCGQLPRRAPYGTSAMVFGMKAKTAVVVRLRAGAQCERTLKCI
jgi:hypothetical protein